MFVVFFPPTQHDAFVCVDSKWRSEYILSWGGWDFHRCQHLLYSSIFLRIICRHNCPSPWTASLTGPMPWHNIRVCGLWTETSNSGFVFSQGNINVSLHERKWVFQHVWKWWRWEGAMFRSGAVRPGKNQFFKFIFLPGFYVTRRSAWGGLALAIS